MDGEQRWQSSNQGDHVARKTECPITREQTNSTDGPIIQGLYENSSSLDAGVPLAACPPVWSQNVSTALADELPVAPTRSVGAHGFRPVGAE